jgi:hypothetical protein
LYITAKRSRQRPSARSTTGLGSQYDKIRVLLAIVVKEGEEKGEKEEGKSTYENGIATLKIMIRNQQTLSNNVKTHT